MAASNPFAKLAADAVSEISPYSPGKPIETLEREYGVSNAIKLASNENPHGPSPAALKAAAEAGKNLARYPDGAGFRLRKALAEHLGVAPEQLTLGNGSNDILVLLAEAFLTPERSAIYDQYSFVVYRLAVKATGAAAHVVPSFPGNHKFAYGHNLQAMASFVDSTTRLIFVANPNNPTGTWVSDDALYAFLKSLPEHVIAVLDEAYLEYARGFAGGAAQDSINWLAEFPNLVIVRTFSKAYGLAGLRVGYAVSSPGIADLLNRIRQPFNVNSIAQAAAVAALADQDWIAQGVAANQAGMRRMEQGIADLGPRTLPSRGNFLLLDMRSAERAATCNEFLLRQGIIVRPVAEYGLAACLRITVGTDAEIDRLLKALTVYPELNS